MFDNLSLRPSASTGPQSLLAWNIIPIPAPPHHLARRHSSLTLLPLKPQIFVWEQSQSSSFTAENPSGKPRLSTCLDKGWAHGLSWKVLLSQAHLQIPGFEGEQLLTISERFFRVILSCWIPVSPATDSAYLTPCQGPATSLRGGTANAIPGKGSFIRRETLLFLLWTLLAFCCFH